MTPDHRISKTAELSLEAQRLRSEHSKGGGRHMKWSAGFREAVTDLLQHGMTVPDISRAIGVSMSTIYGWWRKHEAKTGAAVGDKRPAFAELLVVPDKRVGGERRAQLLVRTRGGHEVMLKMSELAWLFESKVL